MPYDTFFPFSKRVIERNNADCSWSPMNGTLSQQSRTAPIPAGSWPRQAQGRAAKARLEVRRNGVRESGSAVHSDPHPTERCGPQASSKACTNEREGEEVAGLRDVLFCPGFVYHYVHDMRITWMLQGPCADRKRPAAIVFLETEQGTPFTFLTSEFACKPA